MKKLFVVNVDINFDMAVYAEDASEAEDIAQANHREEMDNIGDAEFCAVEARSRRQLQGFGNSYPWTNEYCDERTVDQIADELKLEAK